MTRGGCGWPAGEKCGPLARAVCSSEGAQAFTSAVVAAIQVPRSPSAVAAVSFSRRWATGAGMGDGGDLSRALENVLVPAAASSAQGEECRASQCLRVTLDLATSGPSRVEEEGIVDRADGCCALFAAPGRPRQWKWQSLTRGDLDVRTALRVAALLGQEPGPTSVIDLGCGVGRVVLAIAAAANSVALVRGIELQEARAASRCPVGSRAPLTPAGIAGRAQGRPASRARPRRGGRRALPRRPSRRCPRARGLFARQLAGGHRPVRVRHLL